MTRYFDTLYSGLVPVALVACALDKSTVTVKVRRSRGPWKAGEQINISRLAFVEKAHRRFPYQYVRSAAIDH